MQEQQEIVEDTKEQTETTQNSTQSNDTVDNNEHTESVDNTEHTLENSDTDNNTDDESHEDELIDNVLDNPNMSKGERKRIFKLIQKNQELQNQLLEARTRKNEFEGHNRTPAQNQFQQQQQMPDPRLDPTAPEFNLQLYMKEMVKQQLNEERHVENQKRQAETVLSDYQRVEQSIARAKISDSNFARLMDQYEGYITPDMKYALAESQNPSAFLKHILKNEKDVRALQNLGQKHPSEQVRKFTAQVLSFEKGPGIKSGVASTPRKPEPIPQYGKKGTTSPFNNGYNEKTGTWDQSVINRFLS